MEMFRSFPGRLLAGFVFVLGLVLTGCASKSAWSAPRPFEIRLLRDAELAGDVIVVDVIGVGEEAKGEVTAAIQAGTYFSEDKSYRENKLKLGRSFYFNDTASAGVQHTLARRETIWRDWKRNAVRYLIVAANMRLLKPTDSKIEPRILVIPYDKRKLSPAIKSERAIEIKLTPIGLNSSPPVN